MSLFKSLKTIARKVIFHPFGYDLVPRRKRTSQPAPSGRRKPPSTDNLQLERYVELFGQEAVDQRRFYNLGAGGAFSHPAWTKINKPSEHYGLDNMDLPWDLLAGQPLPIEDSSAAIIFSRYTLEHVPDESVDHFLRQARRSLRPGGYLRLIVPDIEIYYRAYRDGDASLLKGTKRLNSEFPNEEFLSSPNEASLEQRFLWMFASNASTLHAGDNPQRIADEELRRVFAELPFEEALDYCTGKCSLDVQERHPQNHINWFHAEKLLGMMRDAGFEGAYRSAYGQSRCPLLRDLQLFDGRAPEVGLYVEAAR